MLAMMSAITRASDMRHEQVDRCHERLEVYRERGPVTGGQCWRDGRFGSVEHERRDGAVQGEVQACAAVVGPERGVERRRAGAGMVGGGGGVPVGAVVAVWCWSARGGVRWGGRGARDDAVGSAAQWFWRRSGPPARAWLTRLEYCTRGEYGAYAHRLGA